jgi:hypothetical protein
MENLYIAPSSSTPEIHFNPEDSILFINGKSFPADPVSFYKPVFEWLDSYLSAIKSDLALNLSFKLDYYNTSTSKQFAKLFKILEESNIRDNVKINWFYHNHDTDMLEAGQRFSQFTELSFKIMQNLSN